MSRRPSPVMRQRRLRGILAIRPWTHNRCSNHVTRRLRRRAIASGSNSLPVLPGLTPVDTTPPEVAGQVVYLDFDGAQNITYHGLLTVGPFDVPAFTLEGTPLAGQEGAIISAVLSQLQQLFAGSGVLFTTTRPASGMEYSTIYIGGDDAAFSHDGSFLGLAEQVDVGNRHHSDNAWVFAKELGQPGEDATLLADRLTCVTAHEVGHLLGYSHTQ